jgi:hypothetical protein
MPQVELGEGLHLAERGPREGVVREQILGQVEALQLGQVADLFGQPRE